MWINILIIILFPFIANCLYKFFVLRNTQEEHICRGANKIKAYDIATFGSSYARYAFDFTKSPISGYNFGILPQFLFYTEKMIKDYVKTYKPGCYIAITLPDLVFCDPGKGKYGAERYAKLLSRAALGDEYSRKREILEKYFPLLKPSRSNLKRCIKNIILLPKEHCNYLKNHNSMNELQVNEMAIKRCNDWIKEFKLKNTMSDDLPSFLNERMTQSRAILTRIIDFCLKNNLRPILVITPVSKIMNNHLSDEFINKVLLDNIRIANIQNVPVLNYMKDDRFADFDNYINSADLMNYAARLRFTNIFVKDVITAYGSK